MSFLCPKPCCVLHFTKSRSWSASYGVQDLTRPASIPYHPFDLLFVVSLPLFRPLWPPIYFEHIKVLLPWGPLCWPFLLPGKFFTSVRGICTSFFVIFLTSMLKSHLLYKAYPPPIPMPLVSLPLSLFCSTFPPNSTYCGIIHYLVHLSLYVYCQGSSEKQTK